MVVSIKNRLINKEYIFIYKNSTGTWNTCINPEFIARHTMCRAIPVAELNKCFKSIKSLLLVMNNEDILYLNDKRQKFMIKYIWWKKDSKW